GPHPLTLLVFTPWTPSLLVLTPSPPHPLSLGGVRASPPDPLSLRERGDSGLGSGWVRDGVQALGGRRSARRVGGNSRRAHGSLANLVRGCRWSPRGRGSVASAPYNAAKAPLRPEPCWLDSGAAGLRTQCGGCQRPTEAGEMARRKTAPRSKAANGATVGYEAELLKMADALRGSMDAAEYKHVVLCLIFLKYISDAFEEQHKKREAQRGQGADPE